VNDVGYYMAGRGDYYRAYGRGDPGFLSFVGKALGTFGSAIPVVGGALSKVGSVIGRIGEHSTTIAKAAEAAKPILAKGTAIIKAHPVLTGAGAAGVSLGAGAALGKMAAGSPAAAGMAGATGRFHVGRKHRRMRVTNVKALKRAIRRAEGFRRVAMKCIRLTHPQKKARFGGFRYHRKKKR